MERSASPGDVVCLSSTVWETHWGTQHQVMSRLARRGRVLWVELPASPLSPFTGGRRGEMGRALARWRRGPRESGIQGLTLAAPPPVFPFRYHRIFNRLNQWILLRFCKEQARRMGLEAPLLVTFQADSGALARGWKEGRRVYWCADDWSASGRWWQPARLVDARERELVRAADLVVTASTGLREKLEGEGTPLEVITNGVDLELFRPGRGEPAAGGIPRSPGPVIGFAGIMNRHNFDAELLERLARRRGGWSFLLVGGVEGRGVDLSRLQALPNVRFAGYQPRESLPSWIEAMDVCLIPWPESRWVKRAFSLKLFEYLALGKPVVSTWTREYLPYRDLLYLARTQEEFEEGIEAALAEGSGPEGRALAERRVEAARENSWEKKVGQFLQALERLGRPE